MRVHVAAKKAGIGNTVARRLRPQRLVRALRGERQWHWTADEERRLLAVGAGELAALAKQMGRSYFAAYRHRERLLKCSDANGRAKG